MVRLGLDRRRTSITTWYERRSRRYRPSPPRTIRRPRRTLPPHTCPAAHLPSCTPAQLHTCPAAHLPSCTPAQPHTCPAAHLPSRTPALAAHLPSWQVSQTDFSKNHIYRVVYFNLLYAVVMFVVPLSSLSILSRRVIVATRLNTLKHVSHFHLRFGAGRPRCRGRLVLLNITGHLYIRPSTWRA